MDLGLNIEGNQKSIEQTTKSIMGILNSGQDQATIQIAISCFEHVVSGTPIYTTVSNCVIGDNQKAPEYEQDDEQEDEE